MEYIVQVFTGGWTDSLYSARGICEKLQKMTEIMDIKAVIAGWTISPELYKAVGSYLHEKGIEFYLWLPVFSEIGELRTAEPVVNIFGKKTEKYKLQTGESFEFFCPSSKRNYQSMKEIFEEYFSGCGFDGVFLDKIRSQSFVTGADDVLGCCCEVCRGYYDKKMRLDHLEEKLKQRGMKTMMRPKSFTSHCGMHFEDPMIERFFDIKGEIYYRGVKKVSDYFKRKGYKVGMDVYAPILSRLVGQDLERLLEQADFIKPMMYRRTDAPAGIGFEYAMFRRAVAEKDNDNPERTGMEELLSVRSMKDQLSKLQHSGGRIFPGIEINFREGIAETDETYVQQSLEAVAAVRCPGAVLSWDMMLAPEKNLLCASMIQKNEKEKCRRG